MHDTQVKTREPIDGPGDQDNRGDTGDRMRNSGDDETLQNSPECLMQGRRTCLEKMATEEPVKSVYRSETGPNVRASGRARGVGGSIVHGKRRWRE